jgi:3-hydroxyphenylacetate 6-hydroxylase
MEMSSAPNQIGYLSLQNPVRLLALATIVVPILYIIINDFIRAAARIPGLKGPVGLPLIGNLWHIRTNAAEQYRSWSKKYGGVYQIQLGNIPIVVVNTAAAAKAIFGQHSQALSSRPEFYTFHKVSQARIGKVSKINHLCLRYSPTQPVPQSAHLHTATP